MTSTLRVKVGLVTAAVAAVATVFAWPVFTGGWVVEPMLGDISIATHAIVAGVLGVLMAGQLLHHNRRRAYLAGATLPLIALAILALLLTVSNARSNNWNFREMLSPSEELLFFPTGWVWYAAMAAAVVLIIVPIIVPMGLLGTALIRRRWLEAE